MIQQITSSWSFLPNAYFSKIFTLHYIDEDDEELIKFLHVHFFCLK
jgi:hypothetical protein